MTLTLFSAMLVSMAIYPGGKNGDGVYQLLINLMPPHAVYVEPFLGSGAVMRLKRPAAVNIGLDLDPRVIEPRRKASLVGGDDPRGPLAAAIPPGPQIFGSPHGGTAGAAGSPLRSISDRSSPELSIGTSPRFHFLACDAIAYLSAAGPFLGPSALVYCDPPYVRSSRKSPDALYRHEMTDAQHADLLAVLLELPSMVMISGYWSPLYAERLAGWNTRTYTAGTRQGPATEWVWFNFPPPVALHDYRYLGTNFRERERIKRKKARWVKRLAAMGELERRSLLQAISEVGEHADSPT